MLNIFNVLAIHIEGVGRWSRTVFVFWNIENFCNDPLCSIDIFQVVMAVGQLYHHCAPKAEVGIVAKALIRLLRGHR